MRALENREDNPALGKKKKGKPRLKWSTEVRREAQQVAHCLETKPDIERLMLDKQAWAAALRDHVKIPSRMNGELKHHSLMLVAPNSLAPSFVAERFQSASRNIFRSMAAGTTRTMSGTAEVDRANADPVSMLSHSARRR